MGADVRSDAPAIDRQIAELKAAGWKPKTPTIWASPSGRLFVGPHGAWKAMCAMGVIQRLGAIPRRADKLTAWLRELNEADFLTLVRGTVNAIRSGTLDDSKFDCDLSVWSNAIKSEAERRALAAVLRDRGSDA